MMFTVNLASEPVALLKRIRLGLIGLAILLLLGMVAMTAIGLAERRALEMETSRVAQLSAQRSEVEAKLRKEGLVLTDASRTAISAQVTVANQMIAQRLFSWSTLLLQLERATPGGVSLTSVQPQPAAGLTLKGEALALERLTAFVGKLQETRPFHDVFLTDQRGQQDGTVGFTLNVRY
ncbi:MAG: PilN domain-containing protein [Nitrospirae bacterium]|nr:PilN domain-containing protein [Nitrospirota bacterium]